MHTWKMIPVRSLEPIVATAIVGGTVLWGPWITLALAIGVYTAVARMR